MEKMQEALLTIYSASAGSGKTYTLTGKIVQLLLNNYDKYHKHILAVTFTNKATAEMKDRVLKTLHEIVSGKEEQVKRFLYSEGDNNAKVCFNTKIKDPQKLKDKAGKILFDILHDYSHFSIYTIDKFFQRLVRAFAVDMGLNASYQIEMDTTEAIDTALHRLYDNCNDNPQLCQWLTDWAMANLNEGKAWNFENSLRGLTSKVLSEKILADSESHLSGYDRTMLEKYSNDMNTIIDDFLNWVHKQGSDAQDILNKHDLTVNDFPNKSRGFATYFDTMQNAKKMEDLAVKKKSINDAANDSSISAGIWYSKSSKKQNDIIDAANDGLYSILNSVVSNKKAPTAEIIIKHLRRLGILNDMLNELFKYIQDENITFISQASAFLKKIRDGADTPFIYEKIGNSYYNYMIDEFQDTSTTQWENFRPLIINSLAEGNKNLIVGDVKQAIYRWRDSDWTILGEQVEKDCKGRCQTIFLPDNHRSTKEVITFNNEFFEAAKTFIEANLHEHITDNTLTKKQARITKAYKDVKQGIKNNKDKGYVEIQFIGDDDATDTSASSEENTENKEENTEEQGQLKEPILARLCENIERLQDKGYRLRDIAILVRKQSEARAIAEYMLQYQNDNPGRPYRYDVLSNESLLITSSIAVRFLTACMKFILSSSDKINEEVMRECYKQMNEEKPFDVAALSNMRSKSVYDILQELLIKFELYEDKAGNNQSVFLQAFEDTILNFIADKDTDLQTFIDYWEENKTELYMPMPDGQEAIRLLTIHKSKGMEFEAVLIPYCDWDLLPMSGSLQWFSTGSDKPFNAISKLPIPFSSALDNTIFAEQVAEEKFLSIMDNLNLLYVAFTRAKRVLMVTLKTPKSLKKGDKILTSIASILQASLDRLPNPTFANCWNSTNFVYGDFEKFTPKLNEGNNKPKNIYVPFTSPTKSDIKTAVKLQSEATKRGTSIHNLFSKIKNLNDIEPVLQEALQTEQLTQEEYDSISANIQNSITNYPQIKEWFAEDAELFIERDLLSHNAKKQRPDRVILYSDRTILIDYKTGTPDNKKENDYTDQLNNYRQLLEKMNLPNIKAYLWYIDAEEVHEVYP